MGYIIENNNNLNIAHISENGYICSIVYDPSSNPLQPFKTLEELEEYAAQECLRYSNLPPNTNIIIPEDSVYPIENIRRSCDPYDFYLKFNTSERQLILEARKTDTIVDDIVLQLTINGIQSVYSDDSRLLAGMDYLVYKGLITLERKIEIINSIGD